MSGKGFIARTLASHGVPKRTTVVDLSKMMEKINLGKRERSASKSASKSADSVSLLTKIFEKKAKIGKKKPIIEKSDRQLRGNKKTVKRYNPSDIAREEKSKKIKIMRARIKKVQDKEKVEDLGAILGNFNISDSQAQRRVSPPAQRRVSPQAQRRVSPPAQRKVSPRQSPNTGIKRERSRSPDYTYEDNMKLLEQIRRLREQSLTRSQKK